MGVCAHRVQSKVAWKPWKNPRQPNPFPSVASGVGQSTSPLTHRPPQENLFDQNLCTSKLVSAVLYPHREQIPNKSSGTAKCKREHWNEALLITHTCLKKSTKRHTIKCPDFKKLFFSGAVVRQTQVRGRWQGVTFPCHQGPLSYLTLL